MEETSAKRGIGGWLQRHWDWMKWICAVGLLSFLFYSYWSDIAKLDAGNIRWEFAFIALLLCGGSILLTHLRWYLLVWAQEFEFSLKDAIRLGFLGYAFNFIGPGAVGGDLVKAFALARRQESRRTVAVATIVLDRLLGLLALFLVGSGMWLFQSEDMRKGVFLTLATVFGMCSAAGLIGLFLALHTPMPQARWVQWFRKTRFVGKMIGELLDGVGLYQSRPRVIWLAMLISIAGHFGMLSSFFFCGLALWPASAVPDYFAHLLSMPAAELVSMVPIVPGGVGALEWAIAKFYGLAGFVEGNGFLSGIGYRVITILVAALGTGFFFATRQDAQELKDALGTNPADENAADQNPVIRTTASESGPGSPTEQRHDAAPIAD